MITDYLKMVKPQFWYRKNQSDPNLDGCLTCVITMDGTSDKSQPFATGIKCARTQFEIVRDLHRSRITSELNGLQFVMFTKLGRPCTVHELKTEYLSQKNSKTKTKKVIPETPKIVIISDIFHKYHEKIVSYKRGTGIYYCDGIKRLKKAWPELAEMPVSKLSASIAQQLHVKLSEIYSEHTAFVSIKAFNTMLNYAVKMELIENNRAGSFSPKSPVVNITVIEDWEIDAIKAQPISKARDLLLFMIETGLSHVDTLHFTAKVEEINGQMYMYGRRVKTKGEFFNILSDSALDILARYGNRPPKLCYSYFNERLKEVCQEAGIKKIKAHKSRHTLAKRIVDATGDLSLVAHMLGDNIATVQKYYGKMTVKGFAEKLKRSGLK